MHDTLGWVSRGLRLVRVIKECFGSFRYSSLGVEELGDDKVGKVARLNCVVFCYFCNLGLMVGGRAFAYGGV